MALRRMFSLEVVNTDWFQDLPPAAQNLYFHLGMRADDDGFVASPRRVASNVGSKPKDLALLADKGLVIPFPSGACVIRHWKVNNLIKRDRYHETIFQTEMGQLLLNAKNVYELDPERSRSGTPVEPQVRLGKDRSGEDREEAAPAQRPARSRYGWIRLSDEEYQRLCQDLGPEELRRCIEYVDESAQATGNKHHWQDWNLVLRRCHRDRWGLRHGQRQEPVRTAAGYDDEDSFL